MWRAPELAGTLLCRDSDGRGCRPQVRAAAPAGIKLSGFRETNSRNGTYVKTEEEVNGMPAYRREQCKGLWICSNGNNQWRLQTTKDKGGNAGFALQVSERGG